MWKCRDRRGVTLLELMIAMGILLLALLALMSAVGSSSRLVDNSRERTLAYQAARAKIEEIRNYTLCGTYDNIFNYYKAAPNNSASVPGLNPIVIGGVAQPMLQVRFPVDGSGLNLAENPSDAALAAKLGMPKDLNRNGTTSDAGGTLNTKYGLLPVLVQVQWQGIGSKNGLIEVVTFVSEK